MIRRAIKNDIPGIVKIYEKIIEHESQGRAYTGWKKDVYPTEKTALDSLATDELFILEDDSKILATARINQEQDPEYAKCWWIFDVPDSEVMVLHTLVVDPDASGLGIGRKFMNFYEEYALARGCHYLRMDTNVTNTPARAFYKKLGFSERGIIPCVFNGILDVQLVCLEKKLG